MEIIEFDRWKPSEDDPRKLEYAGQRIAQEVFEELKHRLEGMGYLPDEYFLLRDEWQNGREIPRDADLFCTVDYGASEGVYVDVYLKWYDEKQGKGFTDSFITGKTLGENGNDLDRMFLTASAITKAVHGDHATHARYMKIGGVEEDTGGRVVHLSQQEEKVIIAALVEQRERQEEAMGQTEQLLRRMAGSVTAYMDTVGQRPLRISGYDKTVLAIRDGELGAFKALYPKALAEHAADLLVEAAGRPGAVGRKMTLLLMADTAEISEESYRAACRKAIDINDPEKVAFLLDQAEGHVEGLSPSFHGEMACYAWADHRYIAREIIKQCSEEQIAAAPSHLLELFSYPGTADYQMEWGPVVDGEYLPTDPVTADSFAEAGKDIPLLIGSNLLEWNFFPSQSGGASPELTAAVRAAYPGKPELAPNQVDTLLRPPLLKIMSHKAAQGGAPVYSYLFTYGMSFHGAEIPYVFDNLGENSTEAERALAKQVSQVWVNFARNGVPGADGLPEWEPYTQTGGAAMLLDMEPELVHHHDRAVMALEAPELGYYTDVPADAWYARAAEYAAENALMNGVGNGRFGPGQTTSRAMIAAILWRVEGEPKAEIGAEAVDVPDGQWYTDAIRWAQAEGILTGYGDGRFGPNDPLTRQDLVTILWRYADEPKADAPDFADENSIGGYAAQAADWARANEIVGGVGDNKFDPAGSATRAQTAVILQNFLTLNG